MDNIYIIDRIVPLIPVFGVTIFSSTVSLKADTNLTFWLGQIIVEVFRIMEKGFRSVSFEHFE